MKLIYAAAVLILTAVLFLHLDSPKPCKFIYSHYEGPQIYTIEEMSKVKEECLDSEIEAMDTK